MNEIKEKILESREERFQKMQFLKNTFETVITVKTNIPGDDKNLCESYTLVKLFKELIPKSFIDKELFFDSNDGPYYLIGSNYNAKYIKKALTQIEDTHDLGRFIDLDVYDGEKTLSRNNPRKCYICDDIAFNCIRTKKHSIDEVVLYIKESVIAYFESEIGRIINDCMMLELNLHPKFGLVTPETKGSHKDMNYRLMTKAKEAIIPYIVRMFRVGWSTKLNDIFPAIRIIGLEAEQAMFEKTKNVNAYKGLIFNLGILVAAYGYIFIHHHDLENIFSIVESISKDILQDFDNKDNTFGYFAFEKYNITGARGEVHSGIPNVRKALNFLDSFSQSSRLRTLMFLISEVDDTVLLKRCSDIDQYYDIKRMFKETIDKDEEAIVKLDKYCLKHNLSFGGSADLLILTIFLKKIGL